MQLKMKTGLSGPDICLAPGDSHPFDDIEGQRLIDADFAELDTSVDAATTPSPPTPKRVRGSRQG